MDYNTKFDLALVDAYNAAVEMAQPPRTQPEGVAPTPKKRNHNKSKDAPPRQYASAYVGVTVHHGLFAACWRDECKRWKIGPDRPRTPEGELQAAQDYARIMGRDYIERRDGAKVAA